MARRARTSLADRHAANPADVAAACAQADRANRQPRSLALRASHDVAQTTADNSDHWSAADSLGPRSSLDPSVRRTIRERVRYELIENNAIGLGVLLTLVNDTIGTGPRLQMAGADEAANERVETLWHEWFDAVGGTEHLRTLRKAKAVDGEAFANLATVDRGLPVQLDLVPFECDLVSTPWGQASLLDPSLDDGIRYDRRGLPIAYYRAKQHPGDFGWSNDYDVLPADQVLHLFRADRPGQRRGRSEFATGLRTIAELRRYSLAVVAAAETAADLAAVATTSSASQVDPAEVDALDAIPIRRRSILTLPRGWQMNQFQPQQPTTTYDMFRREAINEFARCVNMPFNVAACNSSSYNYASGRLDHQVYYRSIRYEQDYFETACLDRLFAAWLREAALIQNYLPPAIAAAAKRGARLPHGWYWRSLGEHVDPSKEAEAQKTRLQNGTSTLRDEWARAGADWRDKLLQRAAEIQFCRDHGIPLPGEALQTIDPGTGNGKSSAQDAAAKEEAVDDADAEPADV